MKIEKIELNIRNRISAIYFCLNLNYIESSLVLLYSLIDSISWLYSNETNIGKRIVKTDFIKFVEDFFLPALPGYDISAEELYLARCSVVHTNSSLSSSQKDNRQFGYVTSESNREKQNIIIKHVSDNCISINVKDLILALDTSVEKFLKSLSSGKIKEIDKKTRYWYVDCIIE